MPILVDPIFGRDRIDPLGAGESSEFTPEQPAYDSEDEDKDENESNEGGDEILEAEQEGGDVEDEVEAFVDGDAEYIALMR